VYLIILRYSTTVEFIYNEIQGTLDLSSLKILSSSLDVNSNPELKEQMDKLRILAEKVNSEKVGFS
jgi:hypothetical protein